MNKDGVAVKRIFINNLDTTKMQGFLSERMGRTNDNNHSELIAENDENLLKIMHGKSRHSSPKLTQFEIDIAHKTAESFKPKYRTDSYIPNITSDVDIK